MLTQLFISFKSVLVNHCRYIREYVPGIKITAGHPFNSAIGLYGRTKDAHVLAIIKLSPHVKKVPSNQNGYKCLQAKDSCEIELDRCLKNEAVEKASVKGDIPQVAMDL